MRSRRSLRRWAARVTRVGVTCALTLAAIGLMVLIGLTGARDPTHDFFIAFGCLFGGGVLFVLTLVVAEMLRNEANGVRDG